MKPGRRGMARLVAIGAVLALLAASCGLTESSEPLSPEDATAKIRDLADDIGWRTDPISRRANMPPPNQADLADTLPPINEFPLAVTAPRGDGSVVVEIFASTEKSGDGTDGWMVEVAEEFNRSDQAMSGGGTARVEIRKIASGTGYQFIASGKELPGGFSPSNHLWIEMAAASQKMTPIREQMVANVAGIVMKDETAEQLRSQYPSLDAAALIDAVIAGDVVMGYTNPFASSTGLNFLLTVLDDFAEGDEARLTAPDVASVFEQFQRQVPFVALTTLQIRESVQSDNGTLDAFVMEYQTFVNTDSLRSDFEFIPFGVRHDNPLYGVGELSSEEQEVLELFAAFADGQQFQDRAADFGFDPPAYTSDVELPSGSTMVNVQQIWKENKDGGRPVSVVFVVDVSGSMSGTRIVALRKAMLSARDFIKPETRIGVVEFSDDASLRLETDEFDLNQQARYVALAEDLAPGGGTAMYDGVVLGLSLLLDETERDPDIKPLLIVLTDGETTSGLGFGRVENAIAGLRIPVFTVGFEANLDELQRLSSLVEAASINADEQDVEFKMAGLFNAGG